ncbi:MAG: DUF1732 domain-containing protein, partial [Deltaproteobacteria bacterium]|nr:DUF1732 domain-containing protein [Deltaproteobacteria bacterium]
GVADANGWATSLGDVDVFWEAVGPSIEKALKKMVAMRRREGKAMVQTMKAILRKFPSQISNIQKLSTVSVEHYRKRLSDRISEILDNGSVSHERLEEEVAIFAEKSDVTEEFCRLNSHVDEFSRTLGLDEPIGKRLNFILQEMNREVNTIGSKCSEFSITSTVILLKEEIEKLREMVQNAE